MFCAGPFVLRQVGHGGKYIYVYNMLLLPLNYLSIRDLLCSRLIVGGHKSSSRGAVGRMCAIIIDLRAKLFVFPAQVPQHIYYIYTYILYTIVMLYTFCLSFTSTSVLIIIMWRRVYTNIHNIYRYA